MSRCARSSCPGWCGGECAGRSPVDRGKGGLKRSQLADGAGIPLATVSAPANTRDDALLAATLDAVKDFAPLPTGVTVHLDAGYGYRACRESARRAGAARRDRHRGIPAPLQVGRRWVVERTNSWLNDFGTLRRCTERRRDCADAYFALAIALVVIRAPAAGRLVPLPLEHPTTIATHPMTHWRTLRARAARSLTTGRAKPPGPPGRLRGH